MCRPESGEAQAKAILAFIYGILVRWSDALSDGQTDEEPVRFADAA